MGRKFVIGSAAMGVLACALFGYFLRRDHPENNDANKFQKEEHLIEEIRDNPQTVYLRTVPYVQEVESSREDMTKVIPVPKPITNFLYANAETKESRFGDGFFKDTEDFVRWFRDNYNVWRKKDVAAIGVNNNLEKEIIHNYDGVRILEKEVFSRENYTPQHEIKIQYSSGAEGKFHELLLDLKGGAKGHEVVHAFSRVYAKKDELYEEQQRLFNARMPIGDGLIKVSYEIGLSPRSDANPRDYWVFTGNEIPSGFLTTRLISELNTISSSFLGYFDSVSKKNN